MRNSCSSGGGIGILRMRSSPSFRSVCMCVCVELVRTSSFDTQASSAFAAAAGIVLMQIMLSFNTECGVNGARQTRRISRTRRRRRRPRWPAEHEQQTNRREPNALQSSTDCFDVRMRERWQFVFTVANRAAYGWPSMPSTQSEPPPLSLSPRYLFTTLLIASERIIMM